MPVRTQSGPSKSNRLWGVALLILFLILLPALPLYLILSPNGFQCGNLLVKVVHVPLTPSQVDHRMLQNQPSRSFTADVLTVGNRTYRAGPQRPITIQTRDVRLGPNWFNLWWIDTSGVTSITPVPPAP